MSRRDEFDESVLLLGDWLARWRLAVGVSQRALAYRAGINQSGLSRLERGLQVVGARRLATIIATLDRLGAQQSPGPVGPPPFRRPQVDRDAADDARERYATDPTGAAAP
jgi:transcriptional regulator with XRE-family HTH domain